MDINDTQEARFEEVLAYQIWLKLPEETRVILAKLFEIPKTGSVNVEYRATGPVVTMDGYRPDDLRAITVEKMQKMLDTDDDDFYALVEVIVKNIDAIVKGTFKYRPNRKPVASTAKPKKGDRVLIRDAAEDEDKNYYDAYATILKIDSKGRLKLEFEDAKMAEALKDFVYTLKDVEVAPEEPPAPPTTHEQTTQTQE